MIRRGLLSLGVSSKVRLVSFELSHWQAVARTMMETAVKYVEETPEGHWQVAGSGVSLESVAYAYRDGLSAEAIAVEFPTLSLEQVHGAIAFYLHHLADVDKYLADQRLSWADLKAKSDEMNSTLLDRVRTAMHH